MRDTGFEIRGWEKNAKFKMKNAKCSRDVGWVLNPPLTYNTVLKFFKGEKDMRHIIFIVITIALLLSAHPAFTAETNPSWKKLPYRMLDIPMEDNFYGHLEIILSSPKVKKLFPYIESTVISSKKELDSLIENIYKGMPWRQRNNFIEGLEQSFIDFNREVLVLILLTESSVSIEVKFRTPVVKSDKLICTINRYEPQFQTFIVASYCWALAVDKNRIRKIEVDVQGRGITEIDIGITPKK